MDYLLEAENQTFLLLLLHTPILLCQKMDICCEWSWRGGNYGNVLWKRIRKNKSTTV